MSITFEPYRKKIKISNDWTPNSNHPHWQCIYPFTIYYDIKSLVPPYNAESLTNITTCYLFYYLMDITNNYHNRKVCKINSPLFRFILALTKLPLPENFKINQIVKLFNYRSCEADLNMTEHVCYFVDNCPDTRSKKFCYFFKGDSTHSKEYFMSLVPKIKAEHPNLKCNVRVEIRYSGLRFGGKKILPRINRHDYNFSISLLRSLREVENNKFRDKIDFGYEYEIPSMNIADLTNLYIFFKENPYFVCCSDYFTETYDQTVKSETWKAVFKNYH